jgi:hypothetical protein
MILIYIIYIYIPYDNWGKYPISGTGARLLFALGGCAEHGAGFVRFFEKGTIGHH